MLYVVHSPWSDEQIETTCPDTAYRTRRNRQQRLGFPWFVLAVTVPAGVSA